MSDTDHREEGTMPGAGETPGPGDIPGSGKAPGSEARARRPAGTVLVTGATGTVGPHVVRQLLDKGIKVRAGTRRPGAQTFPEGAEPVHLDFKSPATLSAAMVGCDRLFLVRPKDVVNIRGTLKPALDAAAEAGVRHVVYMSAQRANMFPMNPHDQAERAVKHLGARGISWTILRPGFFMQNLIDPHGPDIRERGELIVPAGRARVALIDARDIAAAAVAALRDPGAHADAEYELTGTMPVDFFKIAEILSDNLGKRVIYTNPSVPEFVQAMRRRGHAWPFIATLIGIYSAARLGLSDHATADLEDIIKRAPIGLGQFASDHRRDLAGEAEAA